MGQKKSQNLLGQQQNPATSRENKNLQNLSGSKKSPTSGDKKKRNLSGKKIMQLLRTTKKIMQNHPTSWNKITQPLGTKKSRNLSRQKKSRNLSGQKKSRNLKTKESRSQ